MDKKITYAFKAFNSCGLGATLVRITEILYFFNRVGTKMYMLGDTDKWLLAPDQNNRSWSYYFKNILPTDTNEDYPFINDYHFKMKDQNGIEGKFKELSILLKKIYKPRDNIQEKVNNKLADFGYLTNDNFVAVHIRRSDKVAGECKEGNLIHLEKYLDAVNMYARSNPKVEYLYVATDTDEIINEIKTGNYESYLTIIYDSKETRRDGYCHKLHQGEITDPNDIEDEVITFMKNMELMIRAKQIIGARMSFFFVAAELLRNSFGINLGDNLVYPVKFYTKSFRQTFIINLEHRYDKRKYMESQISRTKQWGMDINGGVQQAPSSAIPNGINPIFIKGVNGHSKDLLLTHKFKVIEGFDAGNALTGPEIGCSLSHLSIWKKIVRDTELGLYQYDDHFLILEDDILFLDNFKYVHDYLAEIDTFDLVFLNRQHTIFGEEKQVSTHLKTVGYSWGAYSYVLTYNGAKKLLKGDFKNKLIQVDIFMPIMNGCPVHSGHEKFYDTTDPLKAYFVDPFVIVPKSNHTAESDIRKSVPFHD
nr:glycosyltransferase family 25 protein [Nitrosopumilus sp.]